MKKLKTVKAPPGARRLIESLRDLGYDTTTAIADLIDNSVNADASKISVEIYPRHNSIPARILIADDGIGMDAENLKNAMRFGSYQNYNVDDLGKYGLGLKTASLSQCSVLTVISKPRQKTGKRSRVAVARWDVDHIYKVDDWDLITPDPEQLPMWMREHIDEFLPDDGGTVVIWSNLEEALPLLESDNGKKSESEVARLLSEVSEHLRMVFHRFMEGGVQGAKKLKISVGHKSLTSWDPFCRNESTKQLTSERVSLISTGGDSKGQKHKMIVQPFILPRQDEFSSKEAFENASGPRKWNFQQGFYFYRNNRLIQSGGWSNLRTPDEHSKLLRISVDFNAALDDSFAINITKMRARIPAEVREQIKNLVSKWNRSADERYRGRSGGGKSSDKSSTKQMRSAIPPVTSTGPKSSAVNLGLISIVPSNAQTSFLTVAKGQKPGQLRMIVPQSHLCAEIFSVNGRDSELKQLCITLLGLIESIISDQIDPETIPLDSLKRQLRKHL